MLLFVIALMVMRHILAKQFEHLVIFGTHYLNKIPTQIFKKHLDSSGHILSLNHGSKIIHLEEKRCKILFIGNFIEMNL